MKTAAALLIALALGAAVAPTNDAADWTGLIAAEGALLSLETPLPPPPVPDHAGAGGVSDVNEGSQPSFDDNMMPPAPPATFCPGGTCPLPPPTNDPPAAAECDPAAGCPTGVVRPRLFGRFRR